MSKLPLTNLANLQNENTAVAAINANNAASTLAMNNTLSRDGTSPNEMDFLLDMNSNRIINLPQAASDGEPVRLKEFNEAILADFTSITPFLTVAGNLSDVANKDTSFENLTASAGWTTPEAHGADGTAIGDTAGIQAATATGKTVFFGPRVYLLRETPDSNHGITIFQGPRVKWVGSGRNKTVLKVSAFTNYEPVFFNQVANGVHICDMTFDGSGLLTGGGRYGGTAAVLYLEQCDYSTIERCNLIGWSNMGLNLNTASNTVVRDCYIQRQGGRTTSITPAIHCFGVPASTRDNNWIDQNFLESAFLNFSGKYSKITNNTIVNWGGSCAINTQPADIGLLVHGNYLEGAGNVPPTVDGTIPAGIEAWAKYSVWSNNIVRNCPGNGMGAGFQNGVVIGNHFVNNGQYITSSDPDNRSGLCFTYGDSTANANHSLIIGNFCYDTGFHTQMYGIREAGPVASTGVVIIGNRCEGNALGAISLRGDTNVSSDLGPFPAQSMTVSAGSGTFSSATGTFTKKYLGGNQYAIDFNVTVSNVGGAGTSIILSAFGGLQFAGRHTWVGYDRATNKMVVGENINANSVQLRYADGTFPGNTGANIEVTGIVEINTN